MFCNQRRVLQARFGGHLVGPRCYAGRAKRPMSPKEDRCEESIYSGIPPLEFSPPESCEKAWLSATRSWIEEAIELPISIQTNSRQSGQCLNNDSSIIIIIIITACNVHSTTGNRRHVAHECTLIQFVGTTGYLTYPFSR